MIKRLILLIIVTMSWNAAFALETVRVLILPFEIYSPDDRPYLEKRIPEIVSTFLKEEGAAVVDADVGTDVSWKDTTKEAGGIRRLGIKHGADYIIWGSLTRVGKRFSMDIKMIQSIGQTPPQTFFAEGEGMEKLSLSVKTLIQKLALKLFKRERVEQVLVSGNQRIESDAIKRVIRTKPGDIYLAKTLSEDLKNIYAMGYFDDIRIEAEDGASGKTITFNVKEKPTIRTIHIKGFTVFKEDEIREHLTIKTGAILNIFNIKSNIQRIESLYKDKNYHNVKVNYDVVMLDTNQADLEFSAVEGEKIRIKKITFVGNKAYPDKELKKRIKTSETGFWSWITSSGDLNREDLEQDAARLTAFYHNNGYIQARVGEPQVEYKDNWIYITIKIDEGPQFKVGKVSLIGDLILPEEELKKQLKITHEAFYNREIIRNDVIMLTDIYSDEGYAYSDINPRIDRNLETLTVDITYVIKKDHPVYFEKIIITGNTRTRDKVIRRELKVYEQELYSGKSLKRGIRNLKRLDFFEDIRVETEKGSSDDKMVLKVDVIEKSTGMFSFGGGYSTVEKVFAMASITQRNLFGRGHILQLKGHLGSATTRYTLSFTEPWLFDIPLSAGFDIYNWERDYTTYDKDSKGAGVRVGYTLYDYTRAYLSYTYDIGDITNITEDASSLVWEMEGENITSSVSATLSYDSRDRVFNPTEGSDHSITVEYAGIGGDIGFTKYVAETGFYIPLLWQTVGFLHGKGGYVRENSGMMLPDYERFYLGGMNSLRGFDWRDVHCFDEEGAEIGGNKFVQFNAELIIPLIKEAGVVGVLFFDTGNVYNNDEDLDMKNLRQSAGFGFRWYSPMGPIRIENGYILDPEEGESRGGRWEFTMGGVF